MKRLGLVLMSVALMLGMAQCKKNVETVSEGIGNQNFTDGIIRLKVNDGGKLAVFPATGAVYYTEGDVIHVASGGAYKGTLTFHDGYFTDFDGTALDDGATMYFYYLGGKTPTESTGASTLTVNISDQTTGYPVISYGVANETYSTTNAEYTATLNNVGALVKFDVTSSSTTSATCIKGMNNQVSFTLSTNAIGYTKADTDGIIKLPAGSGERWAVLLPQDAVAAGTMGSAYTSTLDYQGTCGAVPAIKANDYLSNGISVSVKAPYLSLPGEFTVNESGKTVHFSPGNLQYQASTGTWRFAAQQYTIIGDAAGNNTENEGTRATQADWIDLFGWGTSGWNSGAVAYQPYSISTTNSDYYPGGAYTNSLVGDYANADWGVYNAISNGGNKAGMWRVTTSTEWIYICSQRPASTVNGVANARYAKATVNSVTGLIIFPDSYTHPSGPAVPTNINASAAAFTGNEYTAAEWVLMEGAGAVFLPGAGSRSGATVTADGRGRYWSSTCNNADYACYLDFKASKVYPEYHFSRLYGYSVRLVCD